MRTSRAVGGSLLRPLVFLAVLGLGAPAAAQEPWPKGVTAALVQEGRTLFLDAALCWVCHGPDGNGARGVGPDLTDEEWLHSDGSYEAIVRQITTGVPADMIVNELGAVMPPLGGSSITDEQVRALAAYVWSLRLTTSDAGPTHPGATRLPPA